MRRKPNILFINLMSTPYNELISRFENRSISVEKFWDENLSMPSGLMYLSSYIKKYSSPDRVGFLDYNIKAKNLNDYNNLEEFILHNARNSIDFKPDILAVSLNMSTSHHFYLVAVKILKALWPDVITVAGGNHATNYARILLLDENTDYIIRGEGEIPLAEFIKLYSEGKEINIKGVYSKNNISVDELDTAEFIDDLDIIPFPDWDIIEMESYITGINRIPAVGEHHKKQRRMAGIITTRGCPFRCTFCSSHTVHGRKVRYRSVQNIIDEIKILHQKYGVTDYFLEDDLCTANKERAMSLLSELQKLNIKDFELHIPNGLSIKTLDEELMDKLVETGLNIATLAIESGSEYVQKHIIKKQVDLNKAKDIVKYLRKKKIIVSAFFILGFPGETREQMAESVEYAKELDADWYHIFVATPLAGSEMYKEFVEMGAIKELDVDVWTRAFYKERLFDIPYITADELNDIAYRANLECNFFSNPNMLNGRYEMAITLFERIIKKYHFHIIAWYCLMHCYINLNNQDKADIIRDEIAKIISNDERAASMYKKYSDRMPGLNGIVLNK